MRRSIAIFLAAAAPLVVMGMLTVQVTADNSATSYAKETREMKQRVAQMQNRANLIAQDISRRPNSADPHYRLLNDLNNAIVDMCDEFYATFEATQDMLDNRVYENEMLRRDVIGVRTYLDHMARDIENTLQYMEHLNYQLGRAPTS